MNIYANDSSQPKLISPNSQFRSFSEMELKFAEFLINYTGDAAFCLGKAAEFLYVNDATCRLTEYSREELLSMTLNDIDIDFSWQEWSEQWQYLVSQNYLTFKSRYRSKRGRILLVEVNISYTEYQGQEFSCIFAKKSHEDTNSIELSIQKFTRAELELTQILDKTSMFKQSKQGFISAIYHQFVTTLNVISLSNSLIKRHIDEWEGRKIKPFIGHIQTAVDKLNQILNDLLVLAKIEAVKVNLEQSYIDLVSFSHDLVVKISENNSYNPINFSSQVNCITAQIDKTMLEQILGNLIDNAIKYSPIGNPIDFMITCEAEKVIFQVKDRGIGISELDLTRLFEPFYRGRNIGNIPGTGLGLTIAKTLVESHGGQIAVVSEVGFGTTFIVMFPSTIN
jgi:PAS domain S-box-containing protein